MQTTANIFGSFTVDSKSFLIGFQDIIDILFHIGDISCNARKTEFNDRVTGVPVPATPGGKIYKKLLLSFKQSLQGGDKKTFTKASGTGEEIVFSTVD